MLISGPKDLIQLKRFVIALHTANQFESNWDVTGKTRVLHTAPSDLRGRIFCPTLINRTYPYNGLPIPELFGTHALRRNKTRNISVMQPIIFAPVLFWLLSMNVRSGVFFRTRIRRFFSIRPVDPPSYLNAHCCVRPRPANFH